MRQEASDRLSEVAHVEKNYNVVEVGIEMNMYVMAIGLELLKDKGRVILGLRAGSMNLETLKDMNMDGMNLAMFKDYYYINKIEVVDTNELKQKLDLPAYAIDNNIIHYTKDIRKVDHDFKIGVILVEMIKK